MPVRYRGQIVGAAVAIALLIGVGVVTYFLGSDAGSDLDEAADYVDLDLSTVSGSSAPAEVVLRLPWGSGPADASRKGEPAARSTIEAVFSSEGLVIVVDHPEGVSGARVRWFSAEGGLVGTRLAPPGSTFFRPQKGGFNYVIAKSGGPSETAVVFDVDTSLETTFVVPLQMNSGGLVWSQDTLYASAAPSDVDFEAERIYVRHVLVPVAAGGVQVDDAAADARALDVWGFGLDGQTYTSFTEVMGLNITSSDVTNVIGSGEARVRVPRRYELLGVTADSKVCLRTLPPLAIPTDRPVQTSAAWTSSHDPFDEVLVITLDGKIDASIVLPYSSLLVRYEGTLPMSLCEDGLYTLRADEGGVDVVVHRFQ